MSISPAPGSASRADDRAVPAAAKTALHGLVTVKWGDSVVATKHLVEGADAVLGAALETMLPLPCESLGVPAVTVATVRGGAPICFVPAGAVGFRERPRQVPSPVGGPSEITLAADETVSFAIAGFLVTVTSEEPSKAPWTALGPLRTSLSPIRYVAVAALAHALVIGLSAQAAHAKSLEDTSADDTAALARYLAAADERTQATEKVDSSFGEGSLGKDVNHEEGNGKDGGGARAAGREGSMGSSASRSKAPARFTVSGKNQSGAGSATTREEVLEQARSFGMTSLLQDKTRAPVTSFGDAVAAADPFTANGAMWGTSMGESFGAGGLALSGVGEGGGGRTSGFIGLGEIGTIGHAFGIAGIGTGGAGALAQGLGTWGWSGTYSCGDPWGRRGGIGLGTIGTIGHSTPDVYDLNRAPGRPEKAEDDDGEARLPAETIRRVVRFADGSFRGCYQQELRTNPTLQGGVTTRFLIGADGRVKSAANMGADLPATVVSCVTRVFTGLIFPDPPGGRPVTVSYPLTFKPLENTAPPVTVVR